MLYAKVTVVSMWVQLVKVLHSFSLDYYIDDEIIFLCVTTHRLMVTPTDHVCMPGFQYIWCHMCSKDGSSSSTVLILCMSEGLVLSFK